jgi:hypothetical protein
MRKIASLPIGVLLLLLSLGLFSFLPDAVADDDDGCNKESIVALGDTPIQGNAFLCVDATGVRARLHANGLTPGDAYTIWFGYIDDPSKCATPGQCAALEDVGNLNPVGVLGRLDSAVAPHNGKMHFSGRVGGLYLSSESQVFLFMARHGPANPSDNRARARQLLTPEDPFIGAPQLGNFVDGPKATPAAIAIFNIP